MRKYVSTIGLKANFEEFSRTIDVKFWFEKLEDEQTVKCWVENPRTGGMVKKLGVKFITREQLRDMPEDTYDDTVFFRAALDLFGGSLD